jgi:hypothetical protein
MTTRMTGGLAPSGQEIAEWDAKILPMRKIDKRVTGVHALRQVQAGNMSVRAAADVTP